MHHFQMQMVNGFNRKSFLEKNRLVISHVIAVRAGHLHMPMFNIDKNVKHAIVQVMQVYFG